MSNYTVHSLHYYPIKSLAGHSVNSWELQPQGFKYDRRWMFVDQTHNFMSQRKNPQFVHWQAAVEGGDLVVTKRNDPTLSFRIEGFQTTVFGRRIGVSVWNDSFGAKLVKHRVVKELTEAMEIPGALLVYLDKDIRRPIDPRYATANEYVSFADGYPYLITNLASLQDFSNRVGEELAMNRFRPNIVVKTEQPWEEDQWKNLTIADQPFRLPKPCSRCKVITINQETGESRFELLGKLAEFRKVGNKILFGMNAIWEGQSPAEIKVGDKVTVMA